MSATSFSWTRVGAIVRKDLRDYRRNRFVVIFTMTVLPLIFITVPTVELWPSTSARPS
jgi:ABC-type Na+ efflux pump permease subunit